MDQELTGCVEAVRHFTRFYTRRIGVLAEVLLDSPFTLTEGRIVYEIAHHETTSAKELVCELGLDPGYVSRVLGALSERGYVERSPSARDARSYDVRLSGAGEREFAVINARSRNQVAGMLEALTGQQREALCEALERVQSLLTDPPARHAPYILRPHHVGDMGWVVQRHGVLYAREYGWDQTFEGLVAEIAGAFIRDFDPTRECCLIAEMGGENVGSAFVVRDSDEVAKLRLVIVEPRSRGLGIGRRLVQECIRFARERQYRRMTLWTNSVLLPARALYQQLGFALVASEPHRSFGHDLVGENWDLVL